MTQEQGETICQPQNKKSDLQFEDSKAPETVISDGATDIEKGNTTLMDGPDVDEALKALQKYGNGESLVVTEEDNRRIIRLIDWHLMPLMCCIYSLNYLDKTTLSYASVMGMKEDINLVGDNYQWLGSLFYFGYLGFEFPAARLLQYLPIAKYSSFCIVRWGIVLVCFAACENFAGALVCRLLLGVFEASVTPGFTLITGKWYTKHEQARRVSFWFSFNGWAQVIGGAIAYGIAEGTRKHGSSIQPWKILFIACGIATLLLGIAFWFIIPDSQLNARWLSERDRALAVERIRSNQEGAGSKAFKWYQVKEALLDPMVWAFALISLIAQIPNGGLTNFFNQMIVGLGFSDEMSLLLGMPAGVVEAIALLVSSWVGTRKQSGQIFYASLGGWVGTLGSIHLVALPEHMKIGRLIGYYLTMAYTILFVCLLGMISSKIAGYTKKTVNAGFYMVCYCAGNIIGPHTFRPQDAPEYIPAKIVILVTMVVEVLLVYFVWWWYVRQNKIKEKIRSAPDYVKPENSEYVISYAIPLVYGRVTLKEF